jgi:hypothetical protein
VSERTRRPIAVSRPFLVKLPRGWGLFATVPGTADPHLAAAYRASRERGSAATRGTGAWRVDRAARVAYLSLEFDTPRPFHLSLRWSLEDRPTADALLELAGSDTPGVVLLYPSRGELQRALRAVERGDAAGFLRLGLGVDGVDGSPLRALLG